MSEKRSTRSNASKPGPKKRKVYQNFDEDAYIAVCDSIFRDFESGASIPKAAEVFKESEKDLKLVKSLKVAAVVPRSLVIEKGIDVILINGGFCLGDDEEYNHSLARIAGNMILEAMPDKDCGTMVKKIGGKSMLTPNPRMLSDKAREIYDSKNHDGEILEIKKYLEVFEEPDGGWPRTMETQE
jgi:hypothetical protein